MSSPPLPPSETTEVERLRAIVALRFPVYETRITPRSAVFLVHADPARLEDAFDSLRRELWEKLYVPQIRHERGEYLIEIVRRVSGSPRGYWVNVALLALTIVSTIAAGAFLWLAYRGGFDLAPSDFLFGGVYFAAPLLAMLGLHEFAHFLMARHHHVDASLPYFIPAPPPFLLFGTFGALISLREPIPSKKALLDIGASGPLAGLAVAIPITLLGMALSVHAPALSLANCGPRILGVTYGNLAFGESLLWAGLGLFLPLSPLANLHPLALAGWVGLLITAINLLPAGQLDGGHVFRALFGDRARYVSYVVVALLFGLGFIYSGWFIFAVLVLFLGVRHPPPLNDITPLDAKRWIVGAFAVGILVSGFVLQPIGSPSGDFAVRAGPVTDLPTPPAGYAIAGDVSIVVVNHDLTPHGYSLSSEITQVVANVNGTPRALGGAALASFEANSTWRVTYPNGTMVTYPGTAFFSTTSRSFFEVDSGGSASLAVRYLNTGSGAVSFSLIVGELCSPQVSDQSESYTVS